MHLTCVGGAGIKLIILLIALSKRRRILLSNLGYWLLNGLCYGIVNFKAFKSSNKYNYE